MIIIIYSYTDMISTKSAHAGDSYGGYLEEKSFKK